MGFIDGLISLLQNDKVPARVQQARQSICNKCPHRIAPTNQCGQCGCFLSLKTEVKTEYCPLLKWSVFVG